MKSAPEGLDFFLVAADDMAKLCLVKLCPVDETCSGKFLAQVFPHSSGRWAFPVKCIVYSVQLDTLE